MYLVCALRRTVAFVLVSLLSLSATPEIKPVKSSRSRLHICFQFPFIVIIIIIIVIVIIIITIIIIIIIIVIVIVIVIIIIIIIIIIISYCIGPCNSFLFCFHFNSWQLV